MFTNKHKTIGAIVFEITNDFQKNIVNAIMEEGKRLGYNVAIFSAFGFNSLDYVRVDKKILELPDYESFDGFILALDTINNPDVREPLVEDIKNRCKCPVVSIREEMDDMYNVLIDNQDSMEVIVRHMVEDHDFEDICFVSGPKEHADSINREEIFRRVMAENGKEVKDDQIYYGSFWKYDGPDICNAFIDKRGKVPDAIICANDYMAVSVCNELIDRNYHVPNDVAVSGYDNIWQGSVAQPSITTVEVPFAEMGMKAVQMIDDIVHGRKCEETGYVPTKIIKRESCGCVKANEEQVITARREFYDVYENQREQNFKNTYMTVALENIEDFDKYAHTLANYRVILKGMKKLHVIISPQMIYENELEIEDFQDEMMHFFSVTDEDVRVVDYKIFPVKELLPEAEDEDGPRGYFFVPIHYREFIFGYAAINFHEERGYDEYLRNWVSTMSNSLRDLMIRRKNNELFENLQKSYVHDALTDLLNRRGFEQSANELMQYAKMDDLNFFAVSIDMDRLKYINDTYGHAEGDRLICNMGKALKDTFEEPIVTARTGGDEFCVAGNLQSKEEAEQYIAELKANMDKLGVLGSIGYYCDKISSNDTLDSILKISDKRMYNNKQRRRNGGI